MAGSSEHEVRDLGRIAEWLANASRYQIQSLLATQESHFTGEPAQALTLRKTSEFSGGMAPWN